MADTHNGKRTLLALTVGGSPRPVAYSIRMNRPDRVLFLASEDSASSVDQANERDLSILDLVKEFGHPLTTDQYRTALVPHQELVPCAVRMREELRRELEDLDAGWNTLLDLTGGTKIMSAALVLAGEQFDARYCYVGAASVEGSRDKGGLGVTLDGKERHLIFQNPHDATGLGTLDDAMVLFRSGAWASGARLLRDRHGRMTDPRHKRQLDTWAHLGEGYAAWDRFLYGEAAKHLRLTEQRPEDLRVLLPGPDIPKIQEKLGSDAALLEKLEVTGDDFRPMIDDLLANALRRAGEGDYDEAAIRLYRAAELCANRKLAQEHQIDARAVQVQDLPAEYFEKTGLHPPRDGVLQLGGMQRAYQLLEVLGDPLGERFAKLGLEATTGEESILGLRNQSILIHGHLRLTSRQWKQLKYKILNLLEVEETKLVRFPFLET